MLYYYNCCSLKLLKFISKPQPQQPPGCLQAKLLLQPRRRPKALWRFRAPGPPAPVQPPPAPAELLVAPLMNHIKAVNHKPGVTAGFPPFFFLIFWGEVWGATFSSTSLLQCPFHLKTHKIRVSFIPQLILWHFQASPKQRAQGPSQIPDLTRIE